MENKKTFVTKTFLPPLEEYTVQVKRAFDNNWLTNRGKLVCELEEKLIEYLALKDSKILCTNNGTVPLQIALKLLGKGGEIITTPFSYVATTSAIVWENCTPVFVDIHPDYLTIDESKIEAVITEKTTCILATHVFGNPCNVEEIERIAKKHKLKVIYDAAHCFGVKYKGKSIFEYGDISTCSFHATKVFHTGEGGAIFCKDENLYHEILYSHAFGHIGPEDYFGVGINGKMSELSAAMGLAVLPYMNNILNKREEVTMIYNKNLVFENEKKITIRKQTDWNYSYYPYIYKSQDQLYKIQKILNSQNIFPRRYFYPSLNNLPYVLNKEMKISENISSRIHCFPLFYDIEENIVEEICGVINTN